MFVSLPPAFQVAFTLTNLSNMAKEKDIIEELPAQYKEVLKGLEEKDVALVVKHLPNHNAQKEFSNLVELGIDVAERRAELEANPELKVYGAKLVPALSTLLGIAESTIYHIASSAVLLGSENLRKLASDAAAKGVRLTYSHVRELNRLSKTDHTESIKEICAKLLDGSIVTHRQVKDIVSGVLQAGTLSDAEEIALTKADGNHIDDSVSDFVADALEGDALSDVSTDSEIKTLCSQLIAILSGVEKKIDNIHEKMQDWRNDVSFETLEGMCLDPLDSASVAAGEFAIKVKDIGLLLDEAIRTAMAAATEA